MIETKIKTPTEKERKENAEVSTPPSLRSDMLNLIPSEFWSKPRRVLEPCCGKGGFLIDIYNKFFLAGIKKKVILEKCLYFNDINKNNIELCKELLDPEGKFKLNYNNKDLLKETLDWNDFDAIVSNPPYNSAGKKLTGNTIYQPITKLCVKLIKENGYLLTVHPPSWRKTCTKRCKNFGMFCLLTKENQMIYLSLHNNRDGVKTFGCETQYDYYLLQKVKSKAKTKVNDYDNKEWDLDLTDLNWLPNKDFEFVNKFLRLKGDKNQNVIFNNNYKTRKKKNVKTEGKYTILHSTPKAGNRFYYTDDNSKSPFGISKVVFGLTGLFDVLIDTEGVIGHTMGCMSLIIKDKQEGELIKEFLLSEKFKRVHKACSWSNFSLDWRLFLDFKDNFYLC